MQKNSSLSNLWEKVIVRNPRHQKFLETSLAQLSSAEIQELQLLIAWAEHAGFGLDRIADGYTTIVIDTLKEQLFFNRYGHYRYSSFAEVAEEVYHNPDYMERYMLGLALSSYLWPNHAAMRRHFESHLPKADWAGQHGTYLEIGPGHGFYLKRALETGGFTRYIGIDLSETSVQLTRSVLDYFCPEKSQSVDLRCANFLADTFEGPITGVIMGEVLEHVEEPSIFLKRISEIAEPNAFIHITTCLNAPAVDHITLFESCEQLEALFTANQLKIQDSLIMPYVGTSIEESEARKLPVNVSYVLTVDPS